MAYLANASSNAAKINLNLGNLPTHISSTQAPTKRLPWRTIRASDCIHSATVMLPDELYGLIWGAVESSMPKIRYAKVILKLEQLLQGEFFNEYIKRGMSA
jgi:ribonuclease P/MRP protein subunit RPP40